MFERTRDFFLFFTLSFYFFWQSSRIKRVEVREVTQKRNSSSDLKTDNNLSDHYIYLLRKAIFKKDGIIIY